MNTWLLIILLIIVTSYILELIVSTLNIKALSPELPEEFSHHYDKKDYAKSQHYTKVTTTVSLVENSFNTACTILFILLGGFNYVDIWARSFGFEQIATGLVFIGVLVFFSFLLHLPFSIYSTFSVEEKFGFNRTTPATFGFDLIKTTFLAILLGGPLLAAIMWFFVNSGEYGWVYCWIGVVAFSFLLQFIAPVLIMPLFNKFSPLEHGTLNDEINQYAISENFQIKGIFTMDGSKRSSKLNAFFTGFGKFRKIVFYDTLIDKLTNSEIISVLAHEMGHFKLRHILQMMVASIIQTGVMFFLLSLFLSNESISAGFKMNEPSVYSSLVFFGFLYSPINVFVSIFFNWLSRRNEFAADNYAISSTMKPKDLIESLKKLSKANLANLTPHPLHVFLHYSHPPLLQRIKNIRGNS